MVATARLALLGLVSGAITGAIAVAFSGDTMLYALYIVPGGVFGVVAGPTLRQERFRQPAGTLAYIAAALLANAAAVFLALQSFDAVHHLIDNEIASLAVVGFAAGADGALLLCLAGIVLLPGNRIWQPTVTGALFGALLPVLVEGEEIGTVAFYIVWQTAFAASLAAPRKTPPSLVA